MRRDRCFRRLTRRVFAAPVGAAPVGAAPVGAAPMCAAPVRAAPVRAAPVCLAPMRAAPLGAAPWCAGASRLFAAALWLCTAAAGTAAAQRTTAHPALGVTTRADSLAALARLDSLVLRPDATAAAWHARGLLAWQLSQSQRAVGTRVDRAQLRLNQAADSSLLRAVSLEPANVRFLVDFATYRSQGSPIVRAGATRFIRRAFEAARAQGDSLVVAQMADALGMLAFRDYQSMFGRRMSRSNGPGTSLLDILGQQTGARSSWAGQMSGSGLGSIVADRNRVDTDRSFGSTGTAENAVRELIESRSVPVGGDPPPGVLAFDEALSYFETATRAAPSLPLPWRHRFAALAERRRWEELAVVARERLALAPWDPDAWLARGLAEHRSGQGGAAASFDSAFAQMTDGMRRRLDRVERIMRPAAVKSLDALPPGERARTARFVWTAADPLWSVPGNEVRAEYLARVAFAELRFTDEEKGLHGVDTAPGELHVRYGFPKVTANWACSGSMAEADTPDGGNQICWFWWYAPRLQFIVHYQPIFNHFRGGFDDVAINEEVKAEAPADWSSIPGVPAIDSIPLRVARFRPDGTRPSVFLSAALPLARMRVDGVRTPPPVTQVWMFADGADAVARDSSRASADGLAFWKLRAPAGDLYARAEAVVAGGGAARGTTFAPGAAERAGLAMSDVLVASAVADGATPARRWHDLAILPAPDTLPRARGIALAWEIYNGGAGAGNTGTENTGAGRTSAAEQRYTVRLVLEKASKSVAGRIVAQIGGLVGAQRGNDRVTLSFERTAPVREVTLDHVALSLREAPAGRYVLTVEITDRASGAKVSRRAPLLIGP
ncbi:MAG: GWxTD domain-containing protein [Gemmatimonadaceae bacterium]